MGTGRQTGGGGGGGVNGTGKEWILNRCLDRSRDAGGHEGDYSRYCEYMASSQSVVFFDRLGRWWLGSHPRLECASDRYP